MVARVPGQPGLPETMRKRNPMPDNNSMSSLHARVASLSRTRKPNDPELVKVREQLEYAKLERKITAALDGAPPLSRDQQKRICALVCDGA
jgi:hypothetical protein